MYNYKMLSNEVFRDNVVLYLKPNSVDQMFHESNPKIVFGVFCTKTLSNFYLCNPLS